MGSVIKVNVVYDRPFWRASGLSGTVVALDGADRPIADNSPAGGRPGVLVAFLEGSEGRPFFENRERLFREVTAAVERAFGAQGRQPRHILHKVWAADEWSRGAYGTFNPPGFLSQFGSQLGRPVGPIHWASADLAKNWPGYIDGALESGETTAETVHTSLR